MWTAQQVMDLRSKLRLDIPGFAKLVGVETRTVYRWEAGEARPSGAAEAVLNGLHEKLQKDPDQAESLIAFVAGAVALGGLGFLLYKLLDEVLGDDGPKKRPTDPRGPEAILQGETQQRKRGG
jgi:hypothetical protein